MNALLLLRFWGHRLRFWGYRQGHHEDPPHTHKAGDGDMVPRLQAVALHVLSKDRACNAPLSWVDRWSTQPGRTECRVSGGTGESRRPGRPRGFSGGRRVKSSSGMMPMSIERGTVMDWLVSGAQQTRS